MSTDLIAQPQPFDELCDFMAVAKAVLASIALTVNLRLAGKGVTLSQCLPLEFLWRNGSCTVSRLAGGLGMSSGALTRLLDKLEAKKLCSRTRPPGNRRTVEVELMPEGAVLAAELPPVLGEVIDLHLRSFSPIERASLRALLVRMLRHDASRSRL